MQRRFPATGPLDWQADSLHNDLRRHSESDTRHLFDISWEEQGAMGAWPLFISRDERIIVGVNPVLT